MPDDVTETRTIPAPNHRLDPLTPDDIRRASAAVRAAHDLGAGMMFDTVTLNEPAKDIVRTFQPGQPFPRESFVGAFDRTARCSRRGCVFISDLRARVVNQPSISTDGFKCYLEVIDDYFRQAHYGQIVKSYSADANGTGPARRYSPAVVVDVSKRVMCGDPAKISTSYVERQNLNLRMSQRRFARLTNAFSKKLRNHKAAAALYVAHYNLCRVHESVRVTPAMALGLTDHIWSVEELIAAASMEAPITDRPRFGRFQVIAGGRA